MLVAALLLATPAIDYTCTATPVPAVLAALTAQSGVEMRSTAGFENKLLVLSVKGVEPQTLRDRIADAVSGKWEFRDGAYLLQVDENEQEKRYDAWIDARIAELTQRIESTKLTKIGFGDPHIHKVVLESVKEHGQLLHAMHAVGQMLLKSDLRRVAALGDSEKIVFSTRPTRMQLPLPGCDAILRQVHDTHNLIAEIANRPEIDEPPVGTPQYRARQKTLAKWQPPLRAVMVVEGSSNGPHITTYFADATGKVVEVNPGLMGFTQAKEPATPAIPADVDPNTVVQFSPDAQITAKQTAFYAGSLPRLPDTPDTRESLKKIKKPTTLDPLALHLSEALIQFAKHTDRQLVASVTDDMVTLTESVTWTLQSTRKAIFANTKTRWSESGGWLVVSPSNPYAANASRKALETLINAAPPSEQTLEDIATYAAEADAPWNNAAALPYFMLFASGVPQDDSRWPWLRVYDAMTNSERLRAADGLRIGELSPPARRAIETAVFHAARSDFLMAAPFSVFDREDLSREPTEVMPNGLPPGGILRIAAVESPAAYIEPAQGALTTTGPKGMGQLAFFNSNPEAIGDIDLTRFKLGKHLRKTITCELTPSIKFVVLLDAFERTADDNVYTLETVPADFKKAYDEAVNRAIARRRRLMLGYSLSTILP